MKFCLTFCLLLLVEREKCSLLCFYSVALMNHSCCPNVIVTYKGTVAEVRAVKEIEPGEEVGILLECIPLSDFVPIR